jgi:hypothetical protein
MAKARVVEEALEEPAEARRAGPRAERLPAERDLWGERPLFRAPQGLALGLHQEHLG